MEPLNSWLPLPDNWQTRTDESLGWWLVSAWIGFQADKAGIPRDAVPEQLVEELVRATAAMDSDSVEVAALEKAIRRACNGDMASAGTLLRKIIVHDAVGEVKDRLAGTGLGVRRGGKKGSDRAKETPKGKGAKIREALAAAPKTRNRASLIARQFKVTADYVRKLEKNKTDPP